jgi:hypothetical protein
LYKKIGGVMEREMSIATREALRTIRTNNGRGDGETAPIPLFPEKQIEEEIASQSRIGDKAYTMGLFYETQ